ncbi:MAG: hypothetical protein AAGC60_12285 [Acidobacteriota bacterium]
MSRSTFAPDVVILGAGLAGLTLARHLLLHTERRVLLLERRTELPPMRQKVGESSVQLAGYYFSKVLELEEHLLHDHFMKYNLRFYWRTGDGTAFEDYGAGSIRPFSNIASYQLDRNVFEGELLRLCRAHEHRFRCVTGVDALQIDLADAPDGASPTDDAPGEHRAASTPVHRVTFSAGGEDHAIDTRWLVDTSGRRQLLSKAHALQRPSSIRHGAFYWWVDGLVDIEALTDLDNRARRMHPSRRATGHLPTWLATNHFMDEGLWFWVIPLQGKTSLGLVFDKDVIDHRDVFSVEKAQRFVCERFPLFARDLPHRQVLDFGGHQDFSFDCVQTISSARWAMSGEAGRFTDPLYSPGSDLIAIHNTLVVDAIEADFATAGTPENALELRRKCQLAESLMKAVFQAYVPGYSTSYDALGDQEAFTLKYVWELTIYFALYVFPFINDLFTDRRFATGFLRRFAGLGAANRGVQDVLSGFFRWKQERGLVGAQQAQTPRFVDFFELAPLRRAEGTFYELGVDATTARRILDRHLHDLGDLARFIEAHVASVVLGDPALVHDRRFVEAIDVDDLRFDPVRWAARRDAVAAVRATGATDEPWRWRLDPAVLDRFRLITDDLERHAVQPSTAEPALAAEGAA